MNINIPPDSREWLFASAPADEGRLWSLGRYRPACEVGDPIVFRFDGVAVASAIVLSILEPGDHDAVCHNGRRVLRGWKVTWANSEFVDRRGTGWDPDLHKWKCRMCGCVVKKKSPGFPFRLCPRCGCHFEDLTRRWEEVKD